MKFILINFKKYKSVSMFNFLKCIFINFKKSKMRLFKFSLCAIFFAPIISYGYDPEFLGWKTDFNGRVVEKLSSKENACEALLEKLINTDGLVSHPSIEPWAANVLEHPQMPGYYFCHLVPALNPPGSPWGVGWGQLSPEYVCMQANSYPRYALPRTPYTVPVCVCEPYFFEENGVCSPRVISINGESSTLALPSIKGPITQKINIKKSSDEQIKHRVTVSVKEKNTNNYWSISGVADSLGNFEFIYTPPYFRSAMVDLTADCDKCANTASKTIEILSFEDESQTCGR